MSLTQVSGNMIAANTVFNSISASNGLYSVGNFTGTYTSGAVLDYASGLGRLSVGSSNGLAFYNGGVANTELMRIDSSGNMGIGTSSPNRRLTLQVPDNGGMDFVQGSANQTAYIFWKDSDGTDSGKISYDHGTDAMRFATNSTERLRLDASGNLLLGLTSTPTDRVAITTSSTANGIYIQNSSGQSTSNKIKIHLAPTNDWGPSWSTYEPPYIGAYNDAGSPNSGLVFNTYSSGINSERARIDSSGNFLVGAPAGGNQNLNSMQYLVSNAQGYVTHINGTASGTGYWIFAYNGTAIGTIVQNGTTGVTYNTTSDQRLKENIVDAPIALSSVNAIKVRSFDWKSDGSHIDYGYIAQELLEVAPESVHVPADPDEMMGVDFGKLTPRLVKAIQELSAELNELKAKINQ